MATRKPTTVKRTPPVETPAPARARRPGAVRRTKAAAPPAIAAAPEIHEILEIREEQVASTTATADEQIRVRAYYLHLERRGRPADPASDWLRAEQELAGRDTDSAS